MPLNHEGKIELLRIARLTLEAYLSKKDVPDFHPTDPGLTKPGGAFVTIERNGELRGCIGRMTSEKPLFQTVQEMAVQSATSDTRFPKVTLDELAELEIEISALSPFETLSRERLEDIKIGRHGLIVTQGLQRGLLLPQVAVRENWDREQFLSMTCRKAGLPEDAWKNPKSQIEVFTADVFSERDFRQ